MMMMMEALQNLEEGIRLGGELIKDVKYANDQGMPHEGCRQPGPGLCHVHAVWGRQWLGEIFFERTKST